jgi:hypothetical protein
MALLGAGAENVGMNTADRLHSPGAELLAAAQDFQAAAEQPGSHALAPDLLASLEESPQVLSARATRRVPRRRCRDERGADLLSAMAA